MNEYAEISDHYDLLMTSGYYDYESTAKSIVNLISTEKSIMEVSVETGLLLEKLLEIDSLYILAGMDHTPSMLKIAEKRLGDRAKLFEADIVSFCTGQNTLSNKHWA